MEHYGFFIAINLIYTTLVGILWALLGLVTVLVAAPPRGLLVAAEAVSEAQKAYAGFALKAVF